MVKIYNCIFYFLACLYLLQSFPAFMVLLTNYLHMKVNETVLQACNNGIMIILWSASVYNDIHIVTVFLL